MSRDWLKYGSPYDPGYSGKMQRPQERREQERRGRERLEHQLRGCGDPECPMCNPETVGRGLGSGSGDASGGGWASVSDDLRAAMRRSLGEAIFSLSNEREFLRPGSDEPAKARPPATYAKARKEVEKWVIVAPDQAFGDVVGNDEALEQLRDAIEAPVKHKELYEAYGMKMPKGAMLSGPPGCGKTMFARAAASEMRRLYGDQVEFVSISGSELQSPFVGVTEGYIKSIFTYAREYRAFHGHPLLVFMDEADVLLPDRTGRVRRIASWEESQVATFLAEMDGIQESGAFVLLATNRPEVIDQAVLRDGRCDFKIVVKRPTAEAVEQILRNNFAGILVGEDDVDALVFAALTALQDPHKVIADARVIGIDFAELQLSDEGHRHFLLENLVSGAMAASIPGRAKRHAFARDKVDGVARGVAVGDVLRAVNDIFDENKDLDHSFALEEFKREFVEDVKAKKRGKQVSDPSAPPSRPRKAG